MLYVRGGEYLVMRCSHSGTVSAVPPMPGVMFYRGGTEREQRDLRSQIGREGRFKREGGGREKEEGSGHKIDAPRPPPACLLVPDQPTAMPAVHSKEKGDELTERQARLLRQVKHLIFLNLSAWLMMIPARPEMVLRVTGGDALKTAQILGSMTGGAALFEFLVTPAMGRITDKYGRKPVSLFA